MVICWGYWLSGVRCGGVCVFGCCGLGLIWWQCGMVRWLYGLVRCGGCEGWDGDMNCWCVGELVYGRAGAYKLNPHFKSINLTREEWGEATAIYEFLISLDNVVCYFSLTQYPTTNLYFPKVCNIYKKLHSWEKSDYWDLRKVALYMRWEYFDEYWRNSSLILAITAVLDPRFKMDIVENWYKEIYGIDAHEEHLKMITEDITHVYNKYASSSADANSSTSYNKMLNHLRRSSFTSNSQNIVGELDRYLKEPKFPSIEEFDILTWWRVNTPNFPILTRMARDFLAIPALTPVFDSSFKSQIDHRGYSLNIKCIALSISNVYFHSILHSGPTSDDHNLPTAVKSALQSHNITPPVLYTVKTVVTPTGSLLHFGGL
ncbi:hypothetical protein LWI28_001003 [Acer negundo]|uniref:HAT C-terminal dimerisation domain-containing protein n=1 Tax=Acer negundo TaxID=4023 RepID=A0AAD5P0A3_ACENE|nr:hypothetical protein LWI28_001003 [Acer negundo]